MGQLTVAGLTIKDVTQAFPGGQGYPDAGTYYPTGQPAEYGEPPCFGPVISDRREIAFGSVSWTGEKDYKERKRLIYIDLIVFATLANLRSAVQSVLTTCATHTRYSIILNGVTLLGCKLDLPNCGRGSRIQMGNSMVGEKMPLIFKQLSDTN